MNISERKSIEKKSASLIFANENQNEHPINKTELFHHEEITTLILYSNPSLSYDRKAGHGTKSYLHKETLETIVKVNDYFMKKYADYTLPSFYGRVRPSNIWTRGVYYEGLMALYGIYPREDYYKYAYDWADFHKWGMRNGNTTRNADDHCCGQVYIDLYNMCPSDPNMIRNIKASIDMVVNTPQVNDWWWIDAIQMAMPIYAKFGKMTGEQKYYDKMWDMYSYTRNVHGEAGMYNPKDCLWWRDQDFDPPYKEPNGEDCYWSRGNGWVYAALVQVLDEILPMKHIARTI